MPAPTITVEVQPINIKVNAPPRAPVNVRPSTAAPIIQAKPATGAPGPRVQVVDPLMVPGGLRDAAVGGIRTPTLGAVGATARNVAGVAFDVAAVVFGPTINSLGRSIGRGLGNAATGSGAIPRNINDPRDAGVNPPSNNVPFGDISDARDAGVNPPSSSTRKPFGDPRTTNKQQPSTTAEPSQPYQPPYQPTESPKPAPFDPSSITSPSPRSRPGLSDLVDTPTRTKKPIDTDSPFDLTTIGLNDYGGVNLAYPIAQKLSKLATEISLLKSDPQNQFDYQPLLDKIDTSIKDALSKARIETTVKLPATTNLVAKLPTTTNLVAKLPTTTNINTKLPVAVDLATQLPVNVDLATKLPINVDLATKLPVNVDLATKLPVAVDLATKLPVNVDLATKLPVAVDLATKLPVNVDLATKLPVNVDLATKLPVAVDLATKLPVNVDVKAKLKPEPIKPELKKLQECCEDIEAKLKDVQDDLNKKAPIIEGAGSLMCAEGSTPYSYKGEGLTGIHQLINIVLGVNKQILEKVCDFNIEYPVLQGEGTYNCDGSTVGYHYSGSGFIGLQNQIDQLFGINTKILSEVCESATLPNIAGQIEYFSCDNETQTILFSGSGIEGLSSQVTALTSLVKEVLKTACDASCVPLMPDSRFEEFKVSKQLVITWGLNYPNQSGSLWHTSIPMPKEGLNWCDYFENLYMKRGTHCGRIYWQNSNIYTGGYFESEAEAGRVLTYLVGLSDAQPHRDGNGNLAPRFTKGGSPKRQPVQQTLRAVRAVVADIGADGEPSNLVCFVPPREGCQ